MKKIILLILTISTALFLTAHVVSASENDWVINNETGYYEYVGTSDVIDVTNFYLVEIEKRTASGSSEWITAPIDASSIEFENFGSFFDVWIYSTGSSDVYFSSTVKNIRAKIYDEEKDPLTYTEVEDLPRTTSGIGTVSFKVDGKNLIISITYNRKIYYMHYAFSLEQDMEIFRTIEAYFMNIDEKPQIIINHSRRSYLKDILENPEDESAFVPHSIWDLKTNKIVTQNEYNAYVYIKQNSSGVIIAYFYTDAYIIDSLLSAHVKWYYRERRKGLSTIFFDKYTPWEKREKVMTSDSYTKYRNLTQNWEDFIPLWNIGRGIYKYAKTYQMPQIAQVDYTQSSPYNISVSEVNDYFKALNSNFTEYKENSKYKLWAFALGEGKDGFFVQSEVFNDPDSDDLRNFQIIHMTYETDGQVYEAVGNDINLNIALNPKIDGVANQNQNKWLGIIVIFVSVLYVFGIYKTGSWKSMPKFIRFTVFFVGGIAFISLIYWANKNGYFK